MPSPIMLLVVGLILLIVDWGLGATATVPPPVHVVLRIVGWICVAVGGLLLLLSLLGLGL